MKSKSANSFKKYVKIKTKEYALEYLLGVKSEHRKMDDLIYSELKMQNYLKTEDIPVNEAKNLFQYRTKSANFKDNFGDRYENKGCPLCTVQLDTQVHSVQCEIVKDEIPIEGRYSDIFKKKIPSNISKTLLKISKLREEYI